jgi:hypothetical protein
MDESILRESLIAFYKDRNPAKVSEVDTILTKFSKVFGFLPSCRLVVLMFTVFTGWLRSPCFRVGKEVQHSPG